MEHPINSYLPFCLLEDTFSSFLSTIVDNFSVQIKVQYLPAASSRAQALLAGRAGQEAQARVPARPARTENPRLYQKPERQPAAGQLDVDSVARQVGASLHAP